jgi:hypothetical protein
VAKTRGHRKERARRPGLPSHPARSAFTTCTRTPNFCCKICDRDLHYGVVAAVCPRTRQQQAHTTEPQHVQPSRGPPHMASTVHLGDEALAAGAAAGEARHQGAEGVPGLDLRTRCLFC